MNIEKIGKFIAKCRKEENMTQKELAKRLNVSEKTVSKWECGIGLPEVFTMLDLCSELGINIIDLLKADGEKTWYRYTRVGGTKYEAEAKARTFLSHQVVSDLSHEAITKIKDIENVDLATFKVVIKGYNVSIGNTGCNGHLDVADDTGFMSASLYSNGDIGVIRLLRRMDVGQVFLMYGSVRVNQKVTGGKFLHVEKIQKLEVNDEN